MKTVQITGPGTTALIEQPQPEIRAGEVLLKIGYVGFCGSDLNTFRGANPLARYPIIPGHEIGAVIEAVAADVPPHLRPGMHATVIPYSSCGECPACLNDRPNACEFNQTLGVQRNGAVRAIREAIGLVGIDKLMWGSDYPRTMVAITYRMSYDFILRSSLLSETEKALFLGLNAQKFYGFGVLPELPYIKNMSE